MTGWRAGVVEVHLRANNTWYELWAEQVGAGAEIKSDTQPVLAQFTFGENRYLNIVQAAESYEKERVGNRDLKFRACVHTLLKETDVLGADLIAAYP